jgi:hypothetical protein
MKRLALVGKPDGLARQRRIDLEVSSRLCASRQDIAPTTHYYTIREKYTTRFATEDLHVIDYQYQDLLSRLNLG